MWALNSAYSQSNEQGTTITKWMDEMHTDKTHTFLHRGRANFKISKNYPPLFFKSSHICKLVMWRFSSWKSPLFPWHLALRTRMVVVVKFVFCHGLWAHLVASWTLLCAKHSLTTLNLLSTHCRRSPQGHGTPLMLCIPWTTSTHFPMGWCVSPRRSLTWSRTCGWGIGSGVNVRSGFCCSIRQLIHMMCQPAKLFFPRKEAKEAMRLKMNVQTTSGLGCSIITINSRQKLELKTVACDTIYSKLFDARTTKCL